MTLSLLALAALMGLAIGLRSMPFQKRQAFGRTEAEATSAASLQVVEDVLSIPFRSQLIFWVLLVMMALLIGLLLSPEARKRLIRLVLRIAATYWLLYLLMTRYPEVLGQLGLDFSAAGGLSPADSNNAPLPEFVPPLGSSWISYVLSLALAGILIFAAWRVYSVWHEMNVGSSKSSINKLAKIVRTSLNDLSDGRDSTDVIMNCYFRMSEVVSEKKQIARGSSMTPAEFATRLEQAGFPADAVQRLTRLFESVRYGSYRSDSTMVNEAVGCLTTILHYCGEMV